MAFTDQDIRDYLTKVIPGASDAQIASEMARFNVDVNQMARATNVPVADVQKRFQAATAPATQTTSPKFTDQDVRQYLLDRPGYSDAEITADMIRYNISPEQVSRATQLPLSAIQARYQSVLTPLLATIPGGATTTTGTTTGATPTTPTRVPTAPIPPGLTPGNVDMVTIMPTPPITTGVTPQMPTQYITPAGATTAPPAGVTPYALPMLNMRNTINQGVVPSYVAAPRTTPEMSFTPITQVGGAKIF
jgi:hypothetical protein